jgi:hypothetical protein
MPPAALVPLSADKGLQQKWERDSEVMKNKQLCVGFGPYISQFPLRVPGRVLVHEGEVSVIEKKRKKKVNCPYLSADPNPQDQDSVCP